MTTDGVGSESVACGRADVSLEFAHIYADEPIGPEHLVAAQTMVDVRSEMEAQGLAVSTTVLVDDYNPVYKPLDVGHFIRTLGSLGANPDWVSSEAALVPFGHELLDHLPRRTRRSQERYLDSAGRLSCHCKTRRNERSVTAG